ncbi:MAG: endonuclease III domain-containing protein [Candidatus Cloacimonetes bacterium]|nr:endonuclease III domain-containing protein [Candidatus Cloacimonadota bacterium]
MPAITSLFDALLNAYGPQRWWPGETRDEIIIGAVLTQNTNWGNVERAIDNLKREGLCSLAALRHVEQERLAALIHSSGYYNQKAERLRLLASNLGDLASMSTAAARKRLLAQKGVGPETADSILLYALGRPVFVIDAYTRRIGARLGLQPEADTYSGWQRLFVSALPADVSLFNEYHALLVRHGKHTCRPTPRCEGCCLSTVCKGATL